MAKNIHHYSVQEAQNLGLGQHGSGHLDAGESATSISPRVIVAVCCLEATTFTTLTQDDATYAGTGTSTYANSISNGDTFPEGLTIFGRWTALTVNTGSVIFYLG